MAARCQIFRIGGPLISASLSNLSAKEVNLADKLGGIEPFQTSQPFLDV